MAIRKLLFQASSGRKLWVIVAKGNEMRVFRFLFHIDLKDDDITLQDDGGRMKGALTTRYILGISRVSALERARVQMECELRAIAANYNLDYSKLTVEEMEYVGYQYIWKAIRGAKGFTFYPQDEGDEI